MTSVHESTVEYNRRGQFERLGYSAMRCVEMQKLLRDSLVFHAPRTILRPCGNPEAYAAVYLIEQRGTPMEKSEKAHVMFDRNGVASVDTAELTEMPAVRKQYELGRKIVAAHRKAATARKTSAIRRRGR